MYRTLALSLVLAAALVPGIAHARPAGSQFTVVARMLQSGHSTPVILQAHTRIGSTCTATELNLKNFKTTPVGQARHVGSTGIVVWKWVEPARPNGSVAKVRCTWEGKSQIAMTIVARPIKVLKTEESAFTVTMDSKMSCLAPDRDSEKNPKLSMCIQVLQQGDYMTLIVHTQPGGDCVGSATYMSYNQSPGFETEDVSVVPSADTSNIADLDGNAYWRWRNSSYNPFGNQGFAVVACADDSIPNGTKLSNARSVDFTANLTADALNRPAGTVLPVAVTISPNPMPYNTDPATVTAKTAPGASCTASVTYSTGRSPRSFSGYQETADVAGTVSWTWHEETIGASGVATVTCALNGTTGVGSADFSVD